MKAFKITLEINAVVSYSNLPVMCKTAEMQHLNLSTGAISFLLWDFRIKNSLKK